MLPKFIYAFSFAVMLAGAAPLGGRDVVDPPITSPTAQTVWNVGTIQTVTWDTSGLVNLTQPLGTLLLGFLDTNGENLMINSPLGKGFQLTDGSLDIIVPSVPTKDNYIIALLGSSGNISPTFTINNINGTQSSASGTFESSSPATTPNSSRSVSVSATANTTPTSVASFPSISSHGASSTVTPSVIPGITTSAASSTLPTTALSTSPSVTSLPVSSPVTSATSTVPSGSALSDVSASANANSALSWRVGHELHRLFAAVAVLATLYFI